MSCCEPDIHRRPETPLAVKLNEYGPNVKG